MTDFTATRALFQLPAGVIYLDGNALGPLPRGVQARVLETVDAEWGERLIRAWDRRMAEGLLASPGHGHELRTVSPRCRSRNRRAHGRDDDHRGRLRRARYASPIPQARYRKPDTASKDA